MLVIRLRRIGRKHDPHYRIVVAEHTAPVGGKFIAEVGHYHPKSKEIGLRHEQFLGWMQQGAKPSNTVARLAERAGLAHENIEVKEYHGKPKKKAQERQGHAAKKSASAEKATPKEETVEEAITEEKSSDTETEPAEAEVKDESQESNDTTETEPETSEETATE